MRVKKACDVRTAWDGKMAMLSEAEWTSDKVG